MSYLAVWAWTELLYKLLMVQNETDRLGEQRKFGIYYDDDYDYLQHLKDVRELNDVGIIERFHISADQVVNLNVNFVQY